MQYKNVLLLAAFPRLPFGSSAGALVFDGAFSLLCSQNCISGKGGEMALLGRNLYSSYGDAEEASFRVSRPLK